MSWKLTIDVIFNSFPLIKKQKSDPFSLSLRAKRGNPTTSNRHCEQSEAIQWLQTRHCERSEAIQWFQIPSLRAKRGNPTTSISSLQAKPGNPVTSTPSLRTKWSNPTTLNPSLRAKRGNPLTSNRSLRAKQWFQRGCREKISRIRGFNGSMDFLMQGLMILRGIWTFQCKHWKFLGVYGQKNARTQRN